MWRKYMRKWWITVVVLVLMMPAIAVGSFAQGIVELNVTPGYEGVMVTGNVVPVEVEVNAVGEDVTGTLRISYRDDDREFNVSSEIEIEVAKDSPKKYVIPLMMEQDIYSYDREKFLLAEVYSASDKLIAEQYVGISELTTTSELITGILSDRYAGFTYFNLASPETEEGRNHNLNTIKMTAEHLAESRYLESVDLLVVDGIETALSEEALQNIRVWTEKGGVLLLSTGEQFATQKTLAEAFDLKSNYPLIVKTEGALSGIKQIEFSAPDFDPVPESDGFYKKKIGNGQLLICTYSLSGKKIVETSGSDNVIERVIQKEVVQSGYNMAIDYDQFRQLRHILNRVPKESMPSVRLIMTIVFGYVLLVGPVGYFIIRKRGKSTLYWRMVSGLSIAATIVIFVVGQGIDFNKSIVNGMTIIDQRGDLSHTTSFLGIKHSGIGDVDVAPTDSTIRWSGTLEYGDQPRDKMYYFDDKEHVVFKDIKKFQFVNMMLENKVSLLNESQQIMLGEENSVIEVTNPFDRPLVDVVVLINETTNYIERIEAHESVRVETTDAAFDSTGHRWDVYDFYSQFGSIQSIDDMYAKNRIVEAFFDSNQQGRLGQASSLMVFGWVEDDTTQVIEINDDEIQVTGKSFWVDRLEITKPTSGIVTLPPGAIVPEINMQGETFYDHYDHSFYGYGEVRFDYELPEWLVEEETKIKLDDRNGLEYKLYNYENETWDSLTHDDVISELTVEKQYISDLNLIQVNLVNNGGDMFFGPMLTARGVVQND